MSKFLKGTFILIVAGLFTRMLGFINRIIIARVIGEEGIGLYMMAVPTLVLAITITQMGIPIAISKLIAEADATGNQRKVKNILIVSLATTGIVSLIFCPLLFFSAPWLTQTLFTDSRTYLPLITIVPVIPIIAISSVLRGYFQGKQQMKPFAYSQFIEQIVRISLIAFCTQLFLPYGIEYAAAAALLASVIGELASLLYLFVVFKMKKNITVRKKFWTHLTNGKETFHELMHIALPATGSRLVGSFAWFFEPIVVAHSLAIAGITTSIATRQYGALTGYALPVLMLPSFITYSLATSLVPAISEAAANNQPRVIEHLLRQAIRLTLVTGGLSIVILYVFATPLLQFMYGTNTGDIFIKILAPFFLFYYLQGPFQAALHALNLATASLINSLIGAIVKTALIFALATRPELGIKGAALAIIIGIVLVTVLHYATLLKTLSLSIYIMDYIKIIITMFISGFAGYSAYHFLNGYTLGFKTTESILLTSCLYVILLLLFKLVKKEELVRLPIFGKWLGFFAR